MFANTKAGNSINNVTRIRRTMVKWSSRILNGVYKCPRRLFRNCKNIVEGIINRSTIAVNNTSVRGIPSKAYRMQNIFPSFDKGVTCP